MNNAALQKEFYQNPIGKKILTCIQCGTCSASCPLNRMMDHAPRELFALIRDGNMEEVLRSNTPWFCLSCYQCMSRCPREISVTDIMYLLKQMATEQHLFPNSHHMPDMYKEFFRDIEHNGRVTAASLMRRYGMKHPGDMMGKMSLGIKLLKRNRLELSPQKVRHPGRFAGMFRRKANK